MDIHKEYQFILDMWRFIKRHRVFTEDAWNEGDELLKQHKEIKYAPEMLKAYLDTLED